MAIGRDSGGTECSTAMLVPAVARNRKKQPKVRRAKKTIGFCICVATAQQTVPRVIWMVMCLAAVAARRAGPYGRRVQASCPSSWRLDGVWWRGGGHGCGGGALLSFSAKRVR